MARKWTQDEKKAHHAQMNRDYIIKNMTIAEIGASLNISEKTVFKRLKILGIPGCRINKENYSNKRKNITLPKKHSGALAEFFGILLGDGHLSKYQTMVTLGTKEDSYVQYVSRHFEKICGVPGTIGTRGNGYHDVYVGSIFLTNWLFSQGLVKHKVQSQVRVPEWIEQNPLFSKRFLRGFFDTDGSVYALRHGIQISFTNYSLPILESLQKMLIALEYSPSAVSCHKVYLTKQKDVIRFFSEIRPMNSKHTERFTKIWEKKCVSTQVVYEGRL
jgi:intein/homing endonuclease